MLPLARLGTVGMGLDKNDGLGLVGSQIFRTPALPVLMPASYHIGGAARIEVTICAAYHVYKPWAHHKKIKLLADKLSTANFVSSLQNASLNPCL